LFVEEIILVGPRNAESQMAEKEVFSFWSNIQWLKLAESRSSKPQFHRVIVGLAAAALELAGFFPVKTN
jgi:hypothetical protein